MITEIQRERALRRGQRHALLACGIEIGDVDVVRRSVRIQAQKGDAALQHPTAGLRRLKAGQHPPESHLVQAAWTSGPE